MPSAEIDRSPLRQTPEPNGVGPAEQTASGALVAAGVRPDDVIEVTLAVEQVDMVAVLRGLSLPAEAMVEIDNAALTANLGKRAGATLGSVARGRMCRVAVTCV